MSSYTHYNIQFRPKTKSLVTQNDLIALKKMLFANPKYEDWSGWIKSAWQGMFIYELNKTQNCVVLETTPIRPHYLTNILDEIRDEGKFEIRTICTWEEGNDWLEIYNSDLKDNVSATCIYQFDELRITFFKKARQRELPKIFQKKDELTYSYQTKCQYHGHNEVYLKEDVATRYSLEDRCSLTERENFILSNCAKHEPESDWYSDKIIQRFMKSFKAGEYIEEIESIAFSFDDKLVRLYDSGCYDECFMLDNWFNLDPLTIDNLKEI